MLGLLVEWYTESAIRQGEVDRAVGLDHDIVRPIELASLEALLAITVMLPSSSCRVTPQASASQATAGPEDRA